MKYEMVELKLKTKKSKDYLWSRIDSPKKIIKIEGFGKESKVRKISDNNYEILSKREIILVTFIPKRGVNLIFVGEKKYPLAWFEIKEERNCIISHGVYKRRDSRVKKSNQKKEIDDIKKHFLEELKQIAK